MISPFLAILLIFDHPPLRSFEFKVMRCPRMLKFAQNLNIPLVFIFWEIASNVFSSFKRVANSIMETLTSVDGLTDIWKH